MTAQSVGDCSIALSLLDDYRRGNLSSVKHNQLQNHLDVCDTCSQELAFRTLLVEHLNSSLPSGTIPDQLSPAVRESARAPVHDLAHNDKKMLFLPWMFGAAAVIIFVVALLNNLPHRSFVTYKDVSLVAPPREILDEQFNREQDAGEFAPAMPVPAKREAISSDKARASLHPDSDVTGAGAGEFTELSESKIVNDLSGDLTPELAIANKISSFTTAPLAFAARYTTISQGVTSPTTYRTVKENRQ